MPRGSVSVERGEFGGAERQEGAGASGGGGENANRVFCGGETSKIRWW